MAMRTFDDFAQELREALTHLYDPAYQPPQGLAAILAATQPLPPGTVQQMMIAAIRRLQPGPEVPPTARSRRLYELLSCRYVQELTQEETAERLGITPRHLRREQQQAVQMLAQELWTNRSLAEETWPLDIPVPAPGDEDAESAWRLQVHQELAVLEASDPGVIADVAAVIEQVVRLEQGLAARNATLTAGSVIPGQEAALHPSVLRQLLIVAIQKLAQATTHGQIMVEATGQETSIELLISGAPIAPETPVTSRFIAETVSTHGGESWVERTGERVQFRIRLPRVQPIALLVVDDNADIVHVYRRYLERTRFKVVDAATGQAVFEQIATARPDIVLLDVMLPDMDGWEVLTRLHEGAETRSLPVIICSVVRQEELALALGAARYVPKPVRRPDLIQALEQTLALSSREDRTKPENKARAY